MALLLIYFVHILLFFATIESGLEQDRKIFADKVLK